MHVQIDLTLYPLQYRFVMEKTRHVAMIGGIGTGKTRGLVLKGILKATANPGSLGCLTAPTYPMLEDTTKRTFFEICPAELVAFRNENHNTVGLYCPGGGISEILFRSTSDPEKLRGPNLLWAGMDEAALSSLDAYMILLGRLRAGNPEEQQIFLATTPKGFNWIYNYFGPQVDRSDYVHYYAETKDNIFLPKAYVDSIYQQYSGSFKEQELYGKFVAFEGLIYGDLFHYDTHIGSYPFNPSLNVDLAWDFGYPNPEAVLVMQQDHRGQVQVIDEIYRIKTLTEDIVAVARSRPWFPNVVDCICDESRPDQIVRLGNLGIPARASTKGKILDGITKVRSLLARDPVTKGPTIRIDRRCEMLIQEFGQYRWADKKTQEDEWTEKPIDSYNHALDALRYWTVTKWFPRSGLAARTRSRPPRRVMGYQLMYEPISQFLRKPKI